MSASEAPKPGPMRRVAVFGNAGAGKSTLARKLAAATGLPLHALDLIQYRRGGEQVPHDEYLRTHAELLSRDAWVIDGYGCRDSAWARFEAADTLVYIDLPPAQHYWWVAKRFLKAWYSHPEGWPEQSPLWRSTVASWRVVALCHRHLTPRYRELVASASASKRVHHLRSKREIAAFLAQVASRESNG